MAEPGSVSCSLRRRSQVLLPALLALLLAAAACVTTVTGARALPLRVMTYNIQYGGGGENLPAVRDAIRDGEADIVALQEVDVHWSERSGFADQATWLARELGMEMRYAPIYEVPDTSGVRPVRQFGVALLSRHPIVGFTNHPLMRLSTQSADATPAQQPGLLQAIVEVQGTPVRVFNTHLDYRRDPAVRRQQVAEMLAIIGPSPQATVLFGDLNATPAAPELAPLFATLHDAWPVSSGAGHTFPADAPDRRIDYVLVSRDLRVRGATIPSTTASDHRPLVVDLLLPARRR